MARKSITVNQFDKGLNRAMQAAHKGEYLQAASMCESLMETNPVGDRRKETLRLWGHTLTRGNKFRRASKILKPLWDAAPWDKLVGMSLTMCLLQMSELEEAERVGEAVLELAPENEVLVSMISEIYTRLRKTDRAIGIIDEARQRGLDGGPLAVRFAEIAPKAGRGEEAVEWLREKMDKERSSTGVVGLQFTMGALYERMGEYEKAFECYTKGNEVRAAKYVPANEDKACGRVIADYNAGWVRRMLKGGLDDERPVLIIGLPRSGTTLIEQVIGAHEDTNPLGELTGMHLVRKHVKQRTGDNLHNAAEKLTPFHIKECASIYIEHADNRGGKGAKRMTDKMPSNMWWVGILAAMFPKGRFVHVRRDPRDACLSCYFRNFMQDHPYSTDLAWCAHNWTLMERLADHWRAMFAELGQQHRWKDISYEAFVRDPENAGEDLIRFAGLGWEESLLDIDQDQRNIKTLYSNQLGRKIDTKSLGKWRSYAPFMGPVVETVGDRFDFDNGS